MSDGVRWFFTGVWLFSAIATVCKIDEEREPITSGGAAATVALAAVFIFIVWWF